MSAISSVVLEVPDPSAAEAFYATAFGLGPLVGVRPAEVPPTGFRGFTLSLIVSQPSTVDTLFGAALEAGATSLKPAGVSPDGAGSHGIAIRSDAPPVTDPDGFAWESAPA